MTMKHSPRLFVALGCLVLSLVGARAAEKSSTAMATAADALLKSLTPEQRQQVSFPFDAAERLHWHFIPTDMFPRNGLTVRSMTAPQRAIARTLLELGLSQRGYLTTTAIMEHETLLGALERSGASAEARLMVRDPERYFFAIFGTPSAKGTWGWRVEGHHVSLHFTVVNGVLDTGAPTFFGSNPAEVRQGPKAGLRILAAEEDTARALLMALSPDQRTRALINAAAPDDIATMNTLPINPLTPGGIAASALDAKQRDLLMTVVDAYVGLMASDIAADRMAKLRAAGLETITFAWAGDVDRGKRHYYRVQGPTFLIEYDNTQNDANHIHSVWRDFNGDFGQDLLRNHVTAAAH